MNWFKSLVARWAREGNAIQEDRWENSVPVQRTGRVSISPSSSNILDSDATMTFTVTNAIGGKVVEFRRYDRKRDTSEHAVYVIGKDEDFGEKIAKISTLEVLKN